MSLYILELGRYRYFKSVSVFGIFAKVVWDSVSTLQNTAVSVYRLSTIVGLCYSLSLVKSFI